MISNQVIEESNVTMRHSVLHDQKHSYFDFQLAFDYYEQMFLSLLLQVSMVVLVAGSITQTFPMSLLALCFITLAKILFDSMRLLNYQSTFKISTLQLIYDLIILYLVIYLFLQSAQLKFLNIFYNEKLAENLNEVYHEYTKKFQSQEESEIISLTDKLLKAFNVYH